MFVAARPHCEHRQNAQRHKGKNLAAARSRQFRTQSGQQTQHGHNRRKENKDKQLREIVSQIKTGSNLDSAFPGKRHRRFSSHYDYCLSVRQ